MTPLKVSSLVGIQGICGFLLLISIRLQEVGATTCPVYRVPVNLQCTFVNVASPSQDTSCSATSSSLPCTNALSDGSLEYRTTGTSIGSSLTINFTSSFLINSLKITQVANTLAQINLLQIGFSDGTDEFVNLTKSAASKPEQLSFSRRHTSSIKLTIQTIHDAGTTSGHGYQLIEAYYTNCASDKICDYITLDPTNRTQPSGVFSDTAVFGIIGSEVHAILSTTSSSASGSYVFKIGASSNLAYSLDRVGPTGVKSSDVKTFTSSTNILSTSEWRTFWIDFSSTAVTLGWGSDVRLQYNDTTGPIKVNYVSFLNKGTTTAKIMYCNREVKCYKDAIHFWPLDKPTIADIIGGLATTGSISSITKGPTADHTRLAAYSLSAGAIVLGNFRGKCISGVHLCKNGVTVSFWYKIDQSATGVQYLLSSDVASPGIQIKFENDMIYGYVFDGVTQWTASGKATKYFWEHVAITWHPSNGMEMLLNLISLYRAVTSTAARLADTNSDLVIGKTNDMTGTAAKATISSLAVWEKALTSSEIQKVARCSGLTSDPPISQNALRRLLIPDDFFDASSSLQNSPPRNGRILNRISPTDSGAWIPEVSIQGQYLQVDLAEACNVSTLASQGRESSASLHWTKAFTLSYSLNGKSWKPYKVNGITHYFAANQDGKNIVSFTLCPYVTARFLRFYPVSWKNSAALRVGVLNTGRAVNYAGCFPVLTVTSSHNVDPTNLVPGKCVTSCALQSFTYAALTKGERCFCANAITTAVSDEKCHTPCEGNRAIMCGSDTHYGVYETRDVLSKDFPITFPEKQGVFDPFTITSSLHSTYVLDSEDGLSITFVNNSNPYIFTSTGNHKVFFSAWVGDYATLKLQVTKETHVYANISGSSISCPSMVEALTIFECNVTVDVGTDVILTNILDNENSSTVNIEAVKFDKNIKEPLIKLAGQVTPPKTRLPTEGSRNEDRTFLLLGSVVSYDGMVKTFEINTFRQGYITLQIYRPFCVIPPASKYCLSNGNCVSGASTCNFASLTQKQNCSPSSSVFCSALSQCVESNLACPAYTNPSASATLASSYEVVYETIVFAKLGRQVFLAQQNTSAPNFKVRKGDILGIGLPANISGDVTSALSNVSASFYRNKILTKGEIFVGAGNAAISPVTYVPHASMIYSVPTTMPLSMNLTIGFWNMKSNFSNQYSSENHWNAIIATERIVNSTWIYQTLVALNKSVNVTSLPHPGYNVTHLIEISNVANLTFTHEWTLTNNSYLVIYETEGNHSVRLSAFNLLGSESEQCFVFVMEMIEYVNITKIPATILGQATNATFWVDRGSKVTCNLTFGDGSQKQTATQKINGTMLLFYLHTYADVGEYFFNVTCYNLLSQDLDIQLLIVEKTVEGLTCNLLHAARDIEVNDTISFQASITQGTNPMVMFYLGEGPVNVTGNFIANKSFENWGKYEGNITVYNNVSSRNCTLPFQVHKPVFPINITHVTCPPVNFTFPSPIMMNISSGSDYTCDYNYGDSQTERGASNFSTLGEHVLHTYGAIGSFYVNVNCSNRLHTAKTVVECRVLHPITNLAFVVPSAHDINTNLIGTFSTLRGTNVTYNATVTHLVTGRMQVITAMTVNTDTTSGSFTLLNSAFHDIGIYKIELTAVNDVTPRQTRNETIHVENPITNLFLQCPQQYIQVMHTASFYASVDTGSNATVFWNFKDGNTMTNLFQGDTLRFSGHNITHIFISNGTFLVVVTASNSLGSYQDSCYSHAQHPVSVINLFTSSPQIIPYGEIQFMYNVTSGIPCPTNATIDLNYERAGSESTHQFGNICFKLIRYIFSIPGIYLVNTTMRNGISSKTVNTTVDVQRVVKGLKGTPYHTGGDAGKGAPGRGPDNNTFPLEFPVNITATVSDGTAIAYTWYYGDGSPTVTTKIASVNKTFPGKGSYNVMIRAKNSVSEMTYNLTIVVMESNFNLTFDNDSPTKVTVATKITLQVGQVGSKACCLINLSNDTYYLYKDKTSTVCKPEWSSLPSVVEIFGSTKNVSTSIVFYFWQIHYYWITATCENTISKLSQGRWAIILPLPCDFPYLRIPGYYRSCYNARRFYMSEDIIIVSRNSIDCLASRKSEFSWTIFKWQAENENKEGVLMTHLSEESFTNRSVLVLPARSLGYGFYTVCLNVSLFNLPLVYSVKCVCIKVVPSPLQCFIWGGNGWYQSYYRKATLDGSMAYDPDIPEENNTAGLETNFYCKMKDERYTFPDEENSELVASGNSGGCFNRGPGRLNTSSNVIWYAKETLMSTSTYDFRYYCRKGSRVGHFDARLMMTLLDPPHCAIRLIRSTLFRTVLKSSKCMLETQQCVSYDPGQSYLQITWSLHEQDNNGNWQKINNLQELAISPLTGPYLIIPENTLKGNKKYMAQTVATTQTGPPGLTYYQFSVHQPPHSGSCSVTKSSGFANEKFTFCSKGWLDYKNGTQIWHSYSYKPYPKSVPRRVAYNIEDNCSDDIRLPAGEEQHNYMIEILCLQTDRLGATATATFPVQVLPYEPQTDDFLKKLKEGVDLNGQLVKLEMEDNSEKITEFITWNSEMLNKFIADLDRTLVNYTSLLRATEKSLNDIPTQTPPGTPSPLEDEVKRIKDAIEKLEGRKNKILEISTRLAQSLTTVQLDSTQTAEAASSSIFSLSKHPNSLGFEVKEQLAEGIGRILMFFQNNAASSDPVTASDAIRPVIDGAASVLRAIALSVRKTYIGNSTDDEARTNKDEALVRSLMGKFENATDAFMAHIVPDEQPLQIQSELATFSVSKNYAESLNNLVLPLDTCVCSLPANMTHMLFGNNFELRSIVVRTKGSLLRLIPFTGSDTARELRSGTTTLKIANIIVANLSQFIEVWILKMGPSMKCTRNTLFYGKSRYHKFKVVQNTSSINIDVRPPGNESSPVGITVRVKKEDKPDDDDKFYSVPSNGSEFRGRFKDPYMVFYSSELTNDTAAGEYFVRLDMNRTAENSHVNKVNYTICSYTSDCKYWNEEEKYWSRDGCKVGPLTNSTHTQCLCNHLTSMASDFFVPPNKIDWSKISLDELFKNFTVAAILLTCIGLYFILLIPARRADKRDLKKIGVTPIPSNDPRDNYGYEITLYTGYRTDQGTTADISIVLSGSIEETQPRVLRETDQSRIKFRRGSVDSFLLTVPHRLGELQKLKIWHNHGGENPSWFLIRVLVRDLETDEKVWFICNRWLALQEDDGRIERVLYPATMEQMTNFNLLFQNEARKNLADGHLWFSVVYRPPQSTFTRVQRMTCCLSVLITTMLANAMFYQTGPAPPSSEAKLGPIRLSVRQVGIGVMSSLVVIPVNMIIINIFRKARPKRSSLLTTDPYDNARKYFVIDETAVKETDLEIEDLVDDEGIPEESEEMDKKGKEDKKGKKDKKDKKDKKKDRYIFPHFTIYIAYVLAFLAVSSSSVFTIFYSLTFGKEKAEGWVTAMMISFWQDVLVSQPLKVLAMAIIFALIIKDPNKADAEIQRSAELGLDEEWVHRSHRNDAEFLRKHGFVPKPPGEDILYEPRQFLLKQKEMRAIIKEICVYFIYLSVLCIVAYGSRDPQAYQMTESVTDYFAESKYSGSSPLSSAAEPKNYWDWVQSTLIPTLKPQYWYGPYIDPREEELWTQEEIKRKTRRGGRVKMTRRVKGSSSGSRSYITGDLKPFKKGVIAERGTAYIIGVARLRQLRVKPGGCVLLPGIKDHGYTCSKPYSWENEDASVYKPAWNSANSTEIPELEKDKKSPWFWRSAWDLQGTPYWGKFQTYWGGGYVANIATNRLQTVEEMLQLELDTWIDRYSRAIFAEFALYNANTNFFCIVTLLTEITPTGGYFQYDQVRTMRLYRYTGAEQIIVMAFELVYIIFLFMFTYSELKQMIKLRKKYLEDPWNYTEIMVIVLSYSAIGLYFARLAFGKAAINRMKENADDFISFNYVQLLDDTQNATLSFAVFFAFLKSLKLLRFNRRMGLLTQTVKSCATPLLSFFGMFMIVFLAYVQFAIVAFGSTDLSYASFTGCLSTMLTMTLGGFDFEAIESNNRILGPLFFFSYMVFVFLILVNVFMTIINDALAEVSSDVEKQSNDYEILDFIMHQLKFHIGKDVGPAIKPLYKPQKTKFEQDVDTIESLSENIEYALSNVLVEELRQKNWLRKENMSPKKKILLKAVLTSEEDFNEDDLSNAIPLFEKFLIKHTEKDVEAIVLGQDTAQQISIDGVCINWDTGSDISVADCEALQESNRFQNYEILQGSTRLKSWFFFRKNVKRQSTDPISYREDDESSNVYENLSRNNNNVEKGPVPLNPIGNDDIDTESVNSDPQYEIIPPEPLDDDTSVAPDNNDLEPPSCSPEIQSVDLIAGSSETAHADTVSMISSDSSFTERSMASYEPQESLNSNNEHETVKEDNFEREFEKMLQQEEEMNNHVQQSPNTTLLNPIEGSIASYESQESVNSTNEQETVTEDSSTREFEKTQEEERSNPGQHSPSTTPLKPTEGSVAFHESQESTNEQEAVTEKMLQQHSPNTTYC